jgi:hypothetical protein
MPRLTPALAVLLAAACAEPAAKPAPGVMELSFRVVCEPGETPDAVLPADGLETPFGPEQRFHLQYVGASIDQRGLPAISFEIVESEKERFGDMTEAAVDRPLAIFLMGRFLSAPTVVSRLPGEGIVTGGPLDWTVEERDRLLRELRGE